MGHLDKKLAVLKMLQDEAAPLNIHDVLHRLPQHFAERSVRRWLSQLVQSGLIEKIGQKRSTKYYAARRFSLREQEDGCYRKTCAMCGSIVQSIGIDLLRARYRMQRRQLLSEIILKKKTGSSLERYIQAQTQKLVPDKDRLAFIEDVEEDLVLINPTRIFGLGITPADLQAWKRLNRK